MLTDRFNRRFTYLRLSLTDRCNFRCDYCLPDGNTNSSLAPDINADEVRRLLSAFAELGTRKVRLTGGEPALRKDLPELIQLAKRIEGIEQVALTTNGYKLQRSLNDWVTAGLDQLNVSIDSLDPAIFARITGADRLHDILQGIDQALATPLKRVKLNAVLLRQHNAQSLPSFLNYLKDRPLTLRFIELMRTGQQPSYFRVQHLSAEPLRQTLLASGWQLMPSSNTAGPALEYSHPDYAGNIGLIMPYSPDFCQSCNRLRVSSRGELYTCLFADEHQTLRHLLQSDADRDALKQWLSEAVLGKAETHPLHHDDSGLTQHLAMIGG